MKIKARKEHIEQALELANRVYEGNLIFVHEFKKSGRYWSGVRLRTKKGATLGSRRTARGHRSVNASWEAHRDFMRCLYELDRLAVIKTMNAIYIGRENFYRTYKSSDNMSHLTEPRHE